LNKFVLTIGTGKKLYVALAANLARSFLYWNKGSDIVFQLVTDQPELVPADVYNKIQVTAIKPGEFGLGFSPKLHLDKLVSEGQTLFIDSDCLVYGDLKPVFEKFKGHDVAVVGNYIATGDWFGNVGAVCEKFSISHLPKFNGGIYYLEKGDKASKVYQMARQLEPQYDDIGFIRLRGRPNDELLMSLAMELNQQKPVADDGSILAEFVNFSAIKSDLLKGIAELYNDPNDPGYQKNWHLDMARPVVVHFLGHHNQVMPYVKEMKQLKYLFANGWTEKMARLATFLRVTVPAVTFLYLKNIFRPVYHLIFGVRAIRKSERIVD